MLVYKHLGVGYIAAGLQEKGHAVTYLDCAALGIDIEQALDFVKQESPDLVGLSCFVHGRFMVYELTKRIKALFPELPVVVGGPQVTLFAERVFEECPEISLALCGEADFSFAELATLLEQGQSIDAVPGIVRRDEDGNLIKGPPPEIVQDLDTIPFLARNVYERRLYNPMPMILSLPHMYAEQVITSRGCHWGRCRFCYQSNPNMPCYRRRSPENVIAELRRLVDEYQVEFIIFNDDDFLRDEAWIARFCELYDQEGFSFKWNALARVDTMTPTIVSQVGKHGCVHVTLGIESGNQETLNLIRKGTTLQQARDAVKWCHESGMVVRGNIIIGLPRETPEMVEKSIAFSIELNADYMGFVPYHVEEGTALEEIALQEGHRIPHDNLSLQTPSYVPDTFKDAEEINMMLKKAFQRFYFRPRYILRMLWSVRNPRLWPSLITRLIIGFQIALSLK